MCSETTLAHISFESMLDCVFKISPLKQLLKCSQSSTYPLQSYGLCVEHISSEITLLMYVKLKYSETNWQCVKIYLLWNQSPSCVCLEHILWNQTDLVSSISPLKRLVNSGCVAYAISSEPFDYVSSFMYPLEPLY